MSGLTANAGEVRRSATLFLAEGDVIELRAPKTERDGAISGYFSDPERLAQAVLWIDRKAPGIYVTLNPVNPVLLARSDNRAKSRARETAIDRDIVRRRWLLLDFDPIRPAGISSSDPEHGAALSLARAVKDELRSAGWPEPVYADSGNGGHLLYRIDLPNDAAATDLVKAVLASAAHRWASEEVDVDRAVFNASRISKIYGSVARKGDATADRPHRVSRILNLPAVLDPVPLDLLRTLAAEAPAQKSPPRSSTSAGRRNFTNSTFDLDRFIRDHSIAIARGPDVHEGSERWVLEYCPFNPDHKAPDSVIFRQLGTGRLGFKCLHNSCADKDWAAFRDFYEPREFRRRDRSESAPLPPHPADSVRDSDAISVNAADVEAGADAAIAADDISMAMRLIPNLAALAEVTRVVIVAKLRQHFRKIWNGREFGQALGEAIAQRRAAGAPPPDEEDPESGDPEGPDLLPFPLTDIGNGERLVLMFRQDIRYCIEMKSWLVWDGRRWAVDHFDVMRQKVKAMTRLLWRQGRDRNKSAFKAYARESESYGKATAALGFASTEPGVRITAAELDQHPYLLNCPNGVVNLRDGKILPHNREFLITKLCPVPFAPAAKCEKFIGFLQWAMGANPDAEIGQRTTRMVAFLQRAFGYALTSDVREKAVFVFYGKQGNNGKTTLLSLFRDLLGRDYSGQIAIETVMATAKQQDATMRADLADLRGTRFVVTSEVERESKLNERTIKYITAGDAPIKSCRKYENPIEFWATHKLFMDCNHRPTIRGSEDAIWKRLKLVPFEVQIDDAEIDKKLPDKLRMELPGILAWAVKGCTDWMERGLGEPAEVKAAGKEWREHDDPLKEFLDDCCVVDWDRIRVSDPADRFHVPVSQLSAAYRWWAKRSGEKFLLGREALRERMEAKGFWEYRSRRDGSGKQMRTWEGLELAGETAAAVSRMADQSAPVWDRDG